MSNTQRKRVMLSLDPELAERLKAIGGSKWVAEQLRNSQGRALIPLCHKDAAYLAALLIHDHPMRIDLFKKLTADIFNE